MSKAKELIEMMSEGKAIELPDSLISLVGFGRDTNGNSIVKLKNQQGKGFSIQTNGNLPKTHQKRSMKIKELSKSDLQEISSEVSDYVKKYKNKMTEMKSMTFGEFPPVKEAGADGAQVDKKFINDSLAGLMEAQKKLKKFQPGTAITSGDASQIARILLHATKSAMKGMNLHSQAQGIETVLKGLR